MASYSGRRKAWVERWEAIGRVAQDRRREHQGATAWPRGPDTVGRGASFASVSLDDDASGAPWLIISTCARRWWPASTPREAWRLENGRG